MSSHLVAGLYLSRNDEILASVIARSDKPVFHKHTNYYHELVSSIISQQLSVAAASAIQDRFVRLFAGAFADPMMLLQIEENDLRTTGLSRTKIRSIQDLAQKNVSGDIVFDQYESLSNSEIIEDLTKVTGIGEWTVHMFLMFCMARLNVLPTGDLGIRNGVTHLYSLPTLAKPSDIRTIADANNWHPYESVASWYVWQSIKN